MISPRLQGLGLLLLALSGPACAHRPDSTGLEGLKKAVFTFEQRVRWKDFRGVMELLVPERRQAFDDARTARKDADDLSLTEMETEDAQLSPDGTQAIVVARWSWVRLPSTKVETERVTSHWVSRDGVWLLQRQVGGPFADELDVPADSPSVDAPGDGGYTPR